VDHDGGANHCQYWKIISTVAIGPGEDGEEGEERRRGRKKGERRATGWHGAVLLTGPHTGGPMATWATVVSDKEEEKERKRKGGGGR